MIIKKSCFTWSINPSNKIDRKTVGKWIIWGSKEYIETLFFKIDKLVEKGLIYRAKYAHRENKDEDPFWYKEPMMCVYADDKTKESVLKILKRLGVKRTTWKYDKQTEKDWQLGGRLYEEAKKRHQLSSKRCQSKI